MECCWTTSLLLKNNRESVDGHLVTHPSHTLSTTTTIKQHTIQIDSKNPRESVDGHLLTPATVSEVLNMGWTVKYVLRFDDDVEVSNSW